MDLAFLYPNQQVGVPPSPLGSHVGHPVREPEDRLGNRECPLAGVGDVRFGPQVPRTWHSQGVPSPAGRFSPRTVGGLTGGEGGVWGQTRLS